MNKRLKDLLSGAALGSLDTIRAVRQTCAPIDVYTRAQAMSHQVTEKKKRFSISSVTGGFKGLRKGCRIVKPPSANFQMRHGSTAQARP